MLNHKFNRIGSFMLFVFLFISIPLMANAETECPFAKRRAILMEKVQDGIVVLKAAERQGESYRQNSDFYYLSGFEAPKSAFIIDPNAEKKFVLFVEKSSPMMAVWNGDRPGIQGAMKTFGADTAFAIDEFDEKLKTFLRGKSVVYIDFTDEELAENVLEISKSRWGSYPSEVKKVNPLIHEQRVIKDKHEVAALKKAAEITCDAQIELMRTVKPGMFEYQGKAIINYIYQKAGSKRPGFSSIVGSGPNATVLHDPNYERQMESGDLLLVDIGAEWAMYSADVTRTFPVNGKFSRAQKEIYEIVLAAELAAIEAAKPGAGYKDVMDAAEDVIKEELFKLGLITDLEQEWQYKIWTLHGFGHWLGLNTHDVGDYEHRKENWVTLKPGMVFTIEPGIYFHELALTHLLPMMSKRYPNADVESYIKTITPLFEKYKNIGVRIEDDLLITESGNTVLSAKAPKTISEIEKLMKKKSKVFK